MDSKIQVKKIGSSVYSELYQCSGGSSTDTVVLIAKQGKDDKNSTRNEYDVLSELWEKHFHSDKHYCIPKPIHYSKELNIFFMERFQGVPLAQIYHQKATKLSWRMFQNQIQEHVRESAAWLSKLHSVTATKEEISFESALESDLKALPDISNDKLSSGEIDSCLKQLQKKAADMDIPPHPAAGRHGDFYEENLLVGSDRICAVDFAQYSYGTPLYDISKFMVNLELNGNLNFNNASFFQQLADAFLDAYNSNNTDMQFTKEAVELYNPVLLLQELAWAKRFKHEAPTKNPFVNYTINQLNKYATSEIKRFIKD